MRFSLDWARPFYWREALLCLPAIPLLLVIGLVTGHEVVGVIAAGGALTVAFGASRGLRGQRWGAMLAACAGVAFAAFCGTLLGTSLPLLLACSAISAAACAALGLVDDDLWWVALQIVIALMVSGFFALTQGTAVDAPAAGSVAAAIYRASATLAGGVAQIACVVGLASIFPAARAPLPVGPPLPPADAAALWAQATRAAIVVALAAVLAHAAGLANSYWAPMTALLVVKPGLHDVRSRGVSRMIGTLVGAILATLYVLAVRDNEAALIGGLALAAGSAFALQKADYGAMTAAITATVVMLTSLVAGHVLANAEHRLLNTVLGGAVALVVAWLLPHRDRVAAAEPAADTNEAPPAA
jgi:Fusaric acid resistance protein-like